MNNNKSTIIGFVLMTLVFVGYMIYATSQQQSNLQEQTSNEATTQTETVKPVENKTLAATTADTTKVVTDLAENIELIAKSDSIITVTNEFIEVKLSTKGAQIKGVTMQDENYTKFPKNGEERNELVQLFDSKTAHFNMDYALANNRTISTSNCYFDNVSVNEQDDKTVVTMSYVVDEAAGSSIDHIYTIYNSGEPSRDYVVDFKVKTNHFEKLLPTSCNLPIKWSNTSFQNERSFATENNYTTIAYLISGDDEVDDMGLTTSYEEEAIESNVSWVSFKQQFFSAALIGYSTDLISPTVACSTAEQNSDSGHLKNFEMTSAVAYNPQSPEIEFSFYLGPNKFSILKELKDKNGESLYMEEIIPLGWILSSFISRWVVIPLFDLLQSWGLPIGLVILILTLIVKLAIFPLTYKSYLSTAKMRVIKPEMEALNAKYPRKEDAMKKQQEMMALYKKTGVSPFGGCLPMLIQMPILIAMFRFFPSSIELRGQSFLWSDDLSSYDSIIDLPFDIPFYGDHVSLFCLLMVIVMFIYSYMNYKLQSASQPQMSGMKFFTVYMMPFMMLLWFNNYASGLCYYYLLSNLITILQTTIIRYSLNDDKIRYMIENHAKNTKGKKSRFQQRYEQLMKQAEAQQKAKHK